MTNDRAIEILYNSAESATIFELAEAVDMAIEALKERPHGEWILHFNYGYGDIYKCSKCSWLREYKPSFCENCGADMRQKEGDEK